ncbi:MAG: hypothetical protein KY445_04810 [Armatimonadetes bacterium]|nr:hypothetical protein [Armatimonadota bacterium]
MQPEHQITHAGRSETTCPYCGVGCRVAARIEDGRMQR